MTRRNQGRKPKRREFKVVAKGLRKARRDIERLQHASLDYFNANLEREAQQERERWLQGPSDADMSTSSQQPGDSDADL